LLVVNTILSILFVVFTFLEFKGTCVLIPARMPIIRMQNEMSGIKCDLGVNGLSAIYNTHILAMYARVDPRLPPLGLFVKDWAQKMDIYGASRFRLSTFTLLLMVIQYLQRGCSPPVLPNLQALFPKLFDSGRPVEEVDMDLQLPWDQMRSTNRSTLGELFAGFITYYAKFDFDRWAISVRLGQPFSLVEKVKQLSDGYQIQFACSYRIFVEGE
uniref:PAP-associated domain-containing protein n=1 Tax=Taenia asiatica TaxID=60517 RepID=A0A0R3WEG5_TAEAS